MNRGLSLYLDLLRLVAALEVVAFHLAGFPALGIPRAAWNAYGHEAVTIFFVLSGFVIRHSAANRDSNFETFAVSRLTRVYSVAIPCLALTFAFDLIGHQLSPDLYHHGLTPSGSSWFRIAIGATMLNEAWVSVQMLSNTPYWSISYEFWYYFLFAACFYFTGKQRWLLAFAFAAIAGPKILLLFPIWLLGWAAYVERASSRIPAWLAWLLFIQPVAVLILFDEFHFARAGQMLLEQMMGQDMWRNGLSWSRFVLSDTLLGVSIALHIVGAKVIGNSLWRAISWAERPIKYGAGQSFTMYLLHQPAILFAAACLAAVPLGPWRGIVVALATFGIICLVATVTEGQRGRLKPLVAWAVRQVGALIEKYSRPRRVRVELSVQGD